MTIISEPTPSSRSYSDVEYVFDAHTNSLQPLREYVDGLWRRRRFIVALAKSELQGPRASTLMGELWGVLDPLFQASIYWFLITIIRGRSGGSGAEYLSIVMSGIFLFQFSSTALGDGGRSIMRSKGLMLNSTFPRALLPLAAVYRGLLQFAPGVVIYAIFHVVIGRPLGPGLFLLPLLFLIQVVISVGLALVFSVLTVYIRDMSNLLDYVLRITLFVTPILYPVASIPSGAAKALQINPLFALFASYQDVIQGRMPSPGNVVASMIWAVLLIVVGTRLFRAKERSFALYL